jgi:type I restriction enzyme S subunit
MPYGLKDIELEKLSKVFAANERIERVVLYGSRAKGNYKPFSDVDITMMGSELTHTDLNRISFAIDDLLLPYQFDISIFHTLKNEALIDHIHRVGIAIYERESEWKEYKLGEIAEVIGGGTPDTSNAEYWNGDIPWLTPKDLTGYNGIFISKGERYITKKGLDNSSAKLLPPGTVLLSSRAPIGYVAIASNSICTNQGFKSIICNPQIVDNLFMYYWIRNNVEYLQSLGTGTTFAEISGSVVKSINVVIPSLDIQHRIASILTSLDDKIDLLRRENATLEAMAETLFRQWFVVEAKEEWEEGKLGDWVVIKRGGSPRPINDYIAPTGYRWLKISDVTNLNSPYIFQTKEYIKESGLQKTVYLRKGSLVLSNSATPGIPKILCVDSCIHDGWLYFPKSSFSKIYLYLLFKYIREDLVNLGNGSIFTNLKTDILKDYKVVKPDAKTLENFDHHVQPIFDKLYSNDIQIQTLIQTRDGLLPRLMGGEIKI